jgi:hypothetical protein
MSGALDSIHVIDFGQYLARPLAALRLADQGAEVIHVDSPGGPSWRHPANAALQRGKRSIVLDLKRSNDLAIARHLAASADVAIENFRPGVMERLCLGPLATSFRSRRSARRSCRLGRRCIGCRQIVLPAAADPVPGQRRPLGAVVGARRDRVEWFSCWQPCF